MWARAGGRGRRPRGIWRRRRGRRQELRPRRPQDQPVRPKGIGRRGQFEQATQKAEAFGDTVERIAVRGAASLGRGIGGTLSRLVSGAESAGGAFRKFGLGVLNSLKNTALSAPRKSLPQPSGGGGGSSATGSVIGTFASALLSALFANGGVTAGGGPLAPRRHEGGGGAAMTA